MKRMRIPMIAMSALILIGFTVYAGPQNEDVRRLDPFTGIGIGIHADVFYSKGNTHEIRIEGPERDVQDVITEVRDGVLRVRFDNQRISRSKLTIHITSNELESVKISGSAKFEVSDPLASDEMELAVSGSGSILFKQLTTDEVDAKISGSGSIVVKDGTADEMNVSISGSGNLDAELLEVSECSASISGSGGIRITATEELGVRISGSGKLYYRGDPRINSVSSGSGKVVAL